MLRYWKIGSHKYIVSDSKILKEDWIVFYIRWKIPWQRRLQSIKKVKGETNVEKWKLCYYDIEGFEGGSAHVDFSKKILASTDKRLGLPSPKEYITNKLKKLWIIFLQRKVQARKSC